jgi:hypothetical protein
MEQNVRNAVSLIIGGALHNYGDEELAVVLEAIQLELDNWAENIKPKGTSS